MTRSLQTPVPIGPRCAALVHAPDLATSFLRLHRAHSAASDQPSALSKTALTAPASVTRLRVELANYFAAAVLIPSDAYLAGGAGVEIRL